MIILLLFADDAKIFLQIDNIDDTNLQCDLDSLAAWCTDNHIFLNVNKCKLVRYTNKLDPIIYPYSLNNENLTSCDSLKDLGLIFSSNKKFNHIESIVLKSLRILGLIKRTLNKFLNPPTFVRLYTSLVRSTLEYSSSI